MQVYKHKIPYLAKLRKGQTQIPLPYEGVDNIYAAFIQYGQIGRRHTYYNKRQGKDVTKIIPNADFLLIKERYIDPVTKRPASNMIVVEDYLRPFWITKEQHQTHAYKKEYEDRSKTNGYMTTQWDLPKTIYRKLRPYLPMGGYKSDGDIRRMSDYDCNREIRSSNYLYGIDVDSRTILKYQYQQRFPDYTIPYKVGVLDFETDIETHDVMDMYITIGTVITDDKLYTAVLKEWLDKNSELTLYGKIRDLILKHMPDKDMAEIYATPANLDIKVFDSRIDMCRWLMSNANKEDLDILTGWNFTYDIDCIVKTAEDYSVDVAEVFHDPSIDKRYMFFEYKKDNPKKVSESGKVKSSRPEMLWHKVHTSARFQIVDYMTAHRHIRAGGATVPGGYSLSNILKVEKVDDKLKFKDDAEVAGIQDSTTWHRYMSKYKKNKYIVYNTWDCGSTLKMNRKTHDLDVKLPVLSGVSHLDVFNSGPLKLVDALFFFEYERGYVQGCKDPNQSMDYAKGLGLTGWTLVLNNFSMLNEGTENYVDWSGGDEEKRERP